MKYIIVLSLIFITIFLTVFTIAWYVYPEETMAFTEQLEQTF